jgi:radical SAM superfamily enzyme YgiQ (UPF0313 family)
MIDILFTHSYFLKFDPKEYQAMMPYPPLGTLYAASAARKSGYGVALFDAMLADAESEIEEHLLRHAPRFLVIYDDDFNYLTKMCLERMRQAAFTMARLGKRHGCTVIVHSSDATDHLVPYFDQGVDYIMIGEAERTLCDLLDALTGRNACRPEEIPGITFRNASGEIERGPKREVMRDLDALPIPARDLIDIERYRQAWIGKHGYFSLNMVTTRGCPYHCNWCAKPLYGQVYNSHSPWRIAEEMADIKERFRPDHIWFCDDIFGLKPEWIAEFAREVERLDASIPFKCLSRADLLLRDDTVDALKRSGCNCVWIGAESGAQKILDAMEKGITVEQIYRATIELRNAGIRVGFFLQFGYPGEGEAEIGKTLEMVRRAMPDEIGISVSYPLPGTKFYDRVRAQMGSKRNWSESADLAMMFQGAYGTDFYRVLARFVHKDHRLHQGIEALRRALAGFKAPSKSEARRIALAPYYLVSRTLLSLSMRKLRQPRARQEVLLPVIESR